MLLQIQWTLKINHQSHVRQRKGHESIVRMLYSARSQVGTHDNRSDTCSRERCQNPIQAAYGTETLSSPIPIHWTHWMITIYLWRHPRTASRRMMKPLLTLILYIMATIMICLLLHAGSPLWVLLCDAHSSCNVFNFFMAIR
jgi:hypothetical protein